MPVNVAGEHGGEVWRHVGMADHVLRRRESEVRRPHGRAFRGLVHAQHARRRGVRLPVGVGDQVRELRADVAALARKSGERERRATCIDDERSRTVEDVDVRMRDEAGVREERALVISGNDEYRHPPLGDATQRLERLVCQRWHDRRPVEHVSAMNHDVDLAVEGRLERGRVGGEKVMAAAPPLDARPHGKVEPEVGVGHEQDMDVRHDRDPTLVGVSSVV